MDPLAFAADFVGLPIFMLSYESLIHQPHLEDSSEKITGAYLSVQGQHDHSLLSVNDIDSLWEKDQQSFEAPPLDFDISLHWNYT